MKTGVGADGVQGRGAQTRLLFVGIVVKDGGLDFIEVEDEFLADDVLDRGAEGDVVVAGQGGHGGVGAGTLGQQVFGGGLACGGVLGDGGLDAVDCEPVGWKDNG